MLKNGLKRFEKIEAKNVGQDGGCCWEVSEKSGETRASVRKKDGCGRLVAGKKDWRISTSCRNQWRRIGKKEVIVRNILVNLLKRT